jgi:chemosensory pili system protein ChpA (sensor histidine kinase/response regulator)
MNPRTVLLVDEDLDSLNIYSLILEHHGYRVLRARGGDEGYQLAASELPDVVVTELHLSSVQGRSLAEQLRHDARTAVLPLVAVTSFPVKSGRHTSGLAACDAHLAKPCSPSRMLREVERWATRIHAEPLPTA